MKVAGIEDFDHGSIHHVTDKLYDAGSVDRYAVPESPLPVLGGTERLYRQVPKLIKHIDGRQSSVLFPRHTLLAGVKPQKYEAAICPIVHDLDAYRSGEGDRLWRKTLSDSLTRLQTVDCVIAISEATKRELVQIADVPPNHIEVLTQGIDTDRIYPDETAIDGLDVPENYILYAGALLDRKRPEFLLDVLAELDEELQLHLVICGNQYDSETSTKLLREATQRGLADRLHFVGYVSEANLRRLYTQAAAYLHSAESEGYGRTPVEAVSCGTPAVLYEHIPSAADIREVSRTFSTFDPGEVAAQLEAVAGERVEYTPRTWEDVAADLRGILEKSH